MSCIGCKCNFCAFNVNLDPQYFTPGEVDGCCFHCDDCCAHKVRYKSECDHFRKATKKVEAEAQTARSKIRLIRGGKETPPNDKS